MEKVFVSYREDANRWFWGDRALRRAARQVLRPRPTHLSGMQRVVRNFLMGLQIEGRPFCFNPRPSVLPRERKVISFGLGPLGVQRLRSDTPVIAAIGFPYPRAFPELCERYNVLHYLQHSQWALDLAKSANIYRNVSFGLWHAGVDTDEWSPATSNTEKDIDVLIYYKIHWERELWDKQLLEPIIFQLHRRHLRTHIIRYGCYSPGEYKAKLSRSRTLLFLSPHESQGFAYQEAMSFGVPVIAWNPGQWLDPIRFKYGIDFVAATSVPFFDERCGSTFQYATEFATKFDEFYEKSHSNHYKPREFVLDNLTITSSTRAMLRLYDGI